MKIIIKEGETNDAEIWKYAPEGLRSKIKIQKEIEKVCQSYGK